MAGSRDSPCSQAEGQLHPSLLGGRSRQGTAEGEAQTEVR